MGKNKKGQLLAVISSLGAVGFIIVLVILLATGAGIAYFFTKYWYMIIGFLVIFLSLIYGIKYTLKTPTQKRVLLFIFLLIFGALFIFIPKLGLLQQTFLSGTYIQAPTFYYYECAPASQPVESTHVMLTTGDTNGWVICPSNTDTCDLWISQTETTKWYSTDRRIVYQICHSGGRCDPQVFTIANSFIFNQRQVPSVHISNLLSGDKVWIDYQYQKIIIGTWALQPNGAEYYQTYKPFILWKNDMFGGGRTEYTSISQGCNFPSLAVHTLIKSVTNSVKQITSQTSVSNTNLPFYKTRNFIGTYVPISTANVNFVTYNNQQGYCLNRQIFAITTVVTNGATYQIVDSNFNTRLASSVVCCPGETQPNQKCNSEFKWETIEQAQCSAFNACAGADWMVSKSRTLIRYNCINSKCVAETKAVECTSNADCGNNQVCDTKLYKCIDVIPGQVIINQSTQTQCLWYQESYTSQTKDCGLLSWRSLFSMCKDVTTQGCKTASWLVILIVGGLVIILLVIVVMMLKPARRRRK